VPERPERNDAFLVDPPPPLPTVEAAVGCADDKFQSKPVPKEPPVVEFPAKMVQAAAPTVIGFIRLPLHNRMLGEGLIQ
jgi:hypothetical protein